MDTKILNVLYQSSDLYAPLTGIAMTSLFENNKKLDEINVYLLDDGISEKNKALILKTAQKYNREILFIQTEPIKKKLIELNVAEFKGAYTTYYKLFVSSYIRDIDKIDLLLYMDSDTIIDHDLSEIFNINLDGKIAAARVDLVPDDYKKALGQECVIPYFNCGVILFNVQEWRKQKCEETIIKSIKQDRNKFALADQDIINLLFADNIAFLGLEFNFPSMCYLFSPQECYKVYELQEKTFYTIEEMKKAYDMPIIHHTLTHFGKRPWQKNSGHPQEKVFFKYVKISEWPKFERKNIKRPTIFVLQEMAFLILPKKVYINLHKVMLKQYLKTRNKQYLNSK